jgi:hypothetical protein
VTAKPVGHFCLSDCDGAPNETIGCCPNGSYAFTCGVNQGESHPVCRGGTSYCVCSKGTLCNPISGCCDINGNCLDPCP